VSVSFWLEIRTKKCLKILSWGYIIVWLEFIGFFTDFLFPMLSANCGFFFLSDFELIISSVFNNNLMMVD
jgi:hypothetical protein